MPLNNPKNLLLQSKLITFTRALDSASGDVAYTGVGFRPTALIALSATAGTPSTKVSVGVSDSAGNEMVIYQRDTAGNFIADNSLLAVFWEGAGLIQYAVLKSYDTDGFTLTWSRLGVTAAGTGTIMVLCLR